MSDDILRKVRALLAMAENPAATQDEAEAFAAKAEALIAKYAIDAALLEHKEHRGQVTLRKYPMPNPYAKAKGTLLNAIALTNSCRVVRLGSEDVYAVYGYESDLAIVDMLYTSLLLQSQSSLLRQARSDRSFRTAYWYGFASRVHARLTEVKKVAVADAEVGTALVLRDRASEVDSHVADAFPRMRKGRTTTVRDRSGYNSGSEAASRADLGTTRFEGGRKAIA